MSLNTGNAILSNAISVDSSYNVGIGTSSPTSNANYTSLDIRGTNGSLIYMGSTVNSSLRLVGEGTDAYIDNLTASGSLLFRTGASSPTTRLTIASTGAATFSSSASEPFIINSSNATTLNTQYKYNNGTTLGYIGTGQGLINGGGSTIFAIRSENSMAFSVSGGNTAMTITSGGNVGIGTDAPNSILEVQKDTNGNTPITFINASGGSGNTNASITLDFRLRNGTGGSTGGVLLKVGKETDHIGTNVNDYFAISTTRNDSMGERMRITSSGVVELNATDATYIRYSYLGTTKALIGVAGATSDIISGASAGDLTIRAQQKMQFATGGDVPRMTITSVGQIVMGRTTPSGSGRLTVDGDFYLHNITSGAGQSTLKYNYTSTGLVTFDTSSRLLKKDIENLGYGLDDVLKMSAKKYKWKRDDSIDLGFIADEMVEIIPEIVFFSTEMTNETTGVPIGEPLSINYDRLIPVLIKAIQEQQAQIEAQQQQINSLINR